MASATRARAPTAALERSRRPVSPNLLTTTRSARPAPLVRRRLGAAEDALRREIRAEARRWASVGGRGSGPPLPPVLGAGPGLGDPGGRWRWSVADPGVDDSGSRARGREAEAGDARPGGAASASSGSGVARVAPTDAGGPSGSAEPPRGFLARRRAARDARRTGRQRPPPTRTPPPADWPPPDPASNWHSPDEGWLSGDMRGGDDSD